jgi:hypothetical protein
MIKSKRGAGLQTWRQIIAAAFTGLVFDKATYVAIRQPQTLLSCLRWTEVGI